jgi:hypothetical protein
VYYTAARSGHVDIVRWLQEHGCPYDATKACQAAAVGGSIDVLMYVQQQGMVSTPAVLRGMLNIAAVSDKLSAAQWIRQQGAQWPAVLKYNGRKWSGKALVWARIRRLHVTNAVTLRRYASSVYASIPAITCLCACVYAVATAALRCIDAVFADSSATVT